MGVKLVSSGGGSVEINPPATASNFVATMPAGTGTVAVNGVSSNIVLGTAVASTSGTSIDFTGIPAWVRRITVMLNGVSTSGTSTVQIQIGSVSGGLETSGYSVQVQNSNNASSPITTGFGIENGGGSAFTRGGLATITNVSGNIWSFSSVIGSTGQTITFGAGYKTISSTLDRVRITTVNGTDTFDAGSINIMYE